MTYYFLKIILFLISFIPAWCTNLIAKLCAMIWYIIDKRHRTLAIENLTHAFSEEMSEKKIKALARKNFINTIKIIFEMTKAYRWKPKNLSKHFIVRGMENLKNAHQKGKGVLLLTGHIGNWEMSVHMTTLSGINGSGVYRPLDSKVLNRYVLEKRQMAGCRLYAVKDAAMGILYQLGQGNCCGILCDQNAKRSHGVFVDFFGRKACTNKGLAQFALVTKAPVVPYFIVRDKGKFLIEFGREIPLVDTGDNDADLITNTQNYTKVIEDIVRRFPDQWLWVHNRWKTRPLSS